jgi:hypothetical protein
MSESFYYILVRIYQKVGTNGVGWGLKVAAGGTVVEDGRTLV